MTISALPTPPTRSDPTNFASRADAFLAALPTFQTEANALAVAMNLNATTDTSATSVTIGTGAKSFTVSAGKSFQAGMYLVIADTAAPSTNSMWGQVTSYAGTALVMNIISVLGSGTKTAWTISQSAPNAEFAYATNNSAGKTTPVDADVMPLIDSAAGNTLKKLTWANLKATISNSLTALYITHASTGNNTLTLDNAQATAVDIGAVTLKRNGVLKGYLGIGANDLVSLFDNTGQVRLSVNTSGASVTGALSATSDLTLYGTDGKIIGGTAAGRTIWGNSGTTTYAVAYGASHATLPNMFTIVTNGNVTTQDASGNIGFGAIPNSGWSSTKALDVGVFGSVSCDTATTGEIAIAYNAYAQGVGTWKYKNAASLRASRYGQDSSGSHIWYTAAPGTAGNTIAWTQSMAVGKGTTLALEGATTATGVGIAFPSAQVASSDPNTLDDYEEGTWTPTLGGSATYTVQAGRYVKKGREVTATGTLTVNAIGTGSTTSVSGLPFATANEAGITFVASCGFRTSLATAVTQLVGAAGGGATTIDFYSSTAASGTVALNAAFQAGTRVDFSMTYNT